MWMNKKSIFMALIAITHMIFSLLRQWNFHEWKLFLFPFRWGSVLLCAWNFQLLRKTFGKNWVCFSRKGFENFHNIVTTISQFSKFSYPLFLRRKLAWQMTKSIFDLAYRERVQGTHIFQTTKKKNFHKFNGIFGTRLFPHKTLVDNSKSSAQLRGF